MKKYRYITAIILAFAVFSLSSCQKDEIISSEVSSDDIVVSFSPKLNGFIGTRAIGDASGIDVLRVVVYEGSEQITKKFELQENWNNAKNNGISLTLLKGHTYKILFWAENSSNTAYKIKNDGTITVNYNDYKDGGFAKMEQMDAFCAITEFPQNSAANNQSKAIELLRPLAQLNFADNTTKPIVGTHQAIVTYHNIPVSYNPFTGNVEISDSQDVTFTFEDFPDDVLSVEGSNIYYVSSNYFFAPANSQTNISATIVFQQKDGTQINKYDFISNEITLEKNNKTNVIGSIAQQPETWSIWDGQTKTQPETDKEGRYVIDNATDIAWLCDNGSTLGNNSTFLQTKDIDMSNINASIKLPDGSSYYGGGKTIKNFGNSLFGNATALTVKDLAVENITVSGSTHIGTLVNTLKGSSSFTNVSVTTALATTTNGAAGGMVGYIVRSTEKDRKETLEVSFNGCTLNNVSVSGSASEGKFVGLLSGYDNNESLSFNDKCEATEGVSVKDYTSVYTKANNSAWVTGDITNKYDGWLGAETYRRAKITFGGVRLAPRWDGTTATAEADLLLYNGKSNKYEVHSPFDLAGVRNATASPAALYLMENVDMYGQGADGIYNVPDAWTQSTCDSEDDNYFKSFSNITYLDGNKNGIYNLNINTQKVSTSLYYGGFIQSTSGTTTHKNIKFYNSCVVVPHVVYKNEDKGSAGMLVSNIAGDSYTMENVHTYSCKIFALQKVGGLAARVAATSTSITDCSVNNCYIENYKCEEYPEKFEKSIPSLGVSVTANFYSYGEVGGMFGFVENFATIKGCHVKETTVYAFGQDDKEADMKGSGFLGSLAVAAAKGLGYFLVPGRHVSTFIGDICTSDDEEDEIIITGCTVDSYTTCTNRWDNHNDTYTSIGQAYYIEFKDTKGTVTVDEQTLTLANGNKNTKR